MTVEAALAASGLEPRLAALVRLRASQINGCAYCMQMHAKEAQAQGEADLRLIMLPGWRDTALFDARERAALAWTEPLTRVAKTHAPDTDYDLVASQFSEGEIVALTILIGQINAWNRMQIAGRVAPPAQAA